VSKLLLVMANPWHRGGPPTIADLEVTLEPIRVAWVTERGDNPGVSITNAAEHVWLQVQGAAGGACAVVECYGPRSYAERVLRDERETFDLVTIGDDFEPSWRRLGTSQEEALEALVKIAATDRLRARLLEERAGLVEAIYSGIWHPSRGPA
jgi:hypothetical protein